MPSADQIAEYYDFTETGSGYTGECPCCGYRGFSLTERDGKVLFYCHGMNCPADEIIELFREAGLWDDPKTESDFEPLEDDPQPASGAEQDQATRSSKHEAALAIWRRSLPAAGTPVAAYLRARGYNSGLIPPTLRFATGKHPANQARQPIMVAAVIRPDRPPDLIGVHRTFLLPDGSGKASLLPDRMTLGSVRGGGVPLAAPGPTIAISEGIETGLSFQQATGIPTWAALSAAGIRNLALPNEVQEVWIAADADPVGLRAAEDAASRWHAEGRTVRIVKPPQGMDFNDLGRAEHE